jgi:hypothetical protein
MALWTVLFETRIFLHLSLSKYGCVNCGIWLRCLFREEYCGLEAEEIGFKDLDFCNIKSQVKGLGRNN